MIEETDATVTDSRRSRAWVPVLAQMLAVLLVFAVVGVACGWVWEKVWTPPTGVAYHHRWFPDSDGELGLFSATGWYAVVGVLGGLLAGLVSALVFHRSEVATLVAAIAGSVLAGWLMFQVGTALGPDDPRELARTAADLKPIVGELRTYGDGYRVAFPTGAVLGIGAVFLALNGRRGQHD